MKGQAVSPLLSGIKSNFRKIAMLVLLFFLWIVFQFLTDGIFLTARNLNNLFLQMAYIGIACCGMVLVMVAGHIDLSTGSVIGFTGAVCAVLLYDYNVNIYVAILVTLVVGVLIGCWNALWISYRGIPAFIVTLSTQLIFRGGILGILNSKTVQPNNAVFKLFGQGYLPHPDAGVDYVAVVLCALVVAAWLFATARARNARRKYGFELSNTAGFTLKSLLVSLAIFGVFWVWMNDRGVPVPICILAVVVLVMSVVSRNTPFGKHVFAIGGNSDAARLSGINVKRTTAVVFILMGLLTAVSGIVYTSRLNSAAIAAGQGAELDVITAAIIGGTSTMGGVGTVLGSIIGALIMATLENGMSLMSLGSFEKYMVKGLVLLLAVAFDSLSRTKKD